MTLRDAAADRSIMLQLLQETRDDVRKLLVASGAVEARLSDLERRADAAERPRKASLRRDVGLVTGASALVVALAQLVSAFSGRSAAAQAAPTPQVSAEP